MTTDPLDGLEQLRRIIDEQPEPAPESVMLGLDYCYAEWVAERARHAEEVARLREERDEALEESKGWQRAASSLERERDELQVEMDRLHRRVGDLMQPQPGETLEDHGGWKQLQNFQEEHRRVKEQLRSAESELTSLRSLLPDVRACAEYIVERGVDNADGSARRILAALDSQGIPADVVRAVLNQEVPGG